MSTTTLTCCAAIAASVTLGAQSSATTTTTRIEIKDGKDVKVTGCVEAGPDGGYVLTHVADKSRTMHRYILVSKDDDFSKVVDRRVQIEGKVGDRGHGHVEIKTTTKVEGPAKDTHAKVEDSAPYLGVTHMKTLSASCR